MKRSLEKPPRAVVADHTARRQREEAARVLAAKAAEVAAQMMAAGASEKVTPDHPYLKKKGLPAFPGARVLSRDHRYTVDPEDGQKTARKGVLLVPMFKDGRDGKAQLIGAQMISPDGRKLFLKGTAKGGAWHPVGKHEAPDDPLFIAEGYATAARIHEATGRRAVAAFDAGNLKTVVEAIRKKYPRARLIIMADNDRFTTSPVDNPGVTFARAAAEAIGGAPVIIPQFGPDEVDSTDFDDLAQRHGLDAVRRTIDAALNPPEPEPDHPPYDDAPPHDAMPDDGRDYGEPYDDPRVPFGEDRAPRPEIQVIRGAIHDAVDEANSLLADPALGVFARGGRFVRAVEHRPPSGTLSIRSRGEGNGHRPDGAIVVRELTAAALCEILTRAARWVKWSNAAKDLVSIDCPAEIARMLIERQGAGWKAPQLRAVIRAPSLRPDFSVLAEPGHDSATGLLLMTDRHWPMVPPAPTHQEATAAADTLLQPLEALPFVDNADRAAALALLITAVLRPMLKTAPMFAVTAPAAGTGKSLIVDVASILATGKPATVLTPSRDEAEMEKRLGAAAIEGDAVIAIDNVSHPLESDQLCQFLTQTEVAVRVLGKSENAKVPSTALICATGNNLTVVGDLVRRTIRIRLDAGVERPDERSFNFSPLDRALSKRGEMVAAALTIVKGFYAAGMPNRARPMGSFEDWSDVVRSAVMWLRFPDPRGDVEEMRGEDPETAGLREVMAALPRFPFTAKEIKSLCNSDDNLRATLAGFFDRSGVFSGLRFSGYLRRFRGRIVDGLCIRLERSDEKNGSRWSIGPPDG